MADDRFLEPAEKGYAAFDAGDMGAIAESWADDIVWHVGGDNPLSGTYQGKEAVLGMMARLMQETEGTFKLEVHDMLSSDKHGVVLASNSSSRGGKRAEGRTVHVWHMNDDGKLSEFWAISDNQAGFDALWD